MSIYCLLYSLRQIQRNNIVIWIYLLHFTFRLLTLLGYQCRTICLLDPGWDWQGGMYAWCIVASTVTPVCATPNSLAGIPVLLLILLHNSLYFCWSANQDLKTYKKFMLSWFQKRFLLLKFPPGSSRKLKSALKNSGIFTDKWVNANHLMDVWGPKQTADRTVDEKEKQSFKTSVWWISPADNTLGATQKPPLHSSRTAPSLSKGPG